MFAVNFNQWSRPQQDWYIIDTDIIAGPFDSTRKKGLNWNIMTRWYNTRDLHHNCNEGFSRNVSSLYPYLSNKSIIIGKYLHGVLSLRLLLWTVGRNRWHFHATSTWYVKVPKLLCKLKSIFSWPTYYIRIRLTVRNKIRICKYAFLQCKTRIIPCDKPVLAVASRFFRGQTSYVI